ncbi:MAG: PP2C family protein-serine/threonine phosphatase [Holophagales bacterium]|jgi:sigma-B regulation protein RsbU (phosphoserine phosphatase)|nr:PP2C family protein-serine/threonine phosphatase [Holophagales bacterium]
MQPFSSPFEQFREICFSAPNTIKDLLPLIDFLETFPEETTEESLIHLIGTTALGIVKSSQGGLWDNRKWLFLRGVPPDNPASPSAEWLCLPWTHIDKDFGHLIVKASESSPVLEILLSISAPLLAWCRLEQLRTDQNRALALQISRLNTLFELTRHFGIGELENKRDIVHHFANTLAGEFMIQRILALDINGTVLLGKGLGVIPNSLDGDALEDLIKAKELSFAAELKDQDHSHGFVYLADSAKGPLSDEDKLFLQTLFYITSGHLSALKLRESRIQAIKMEKDMELARNIQRRILPQRLPEPDGWQCAAANLPYDAVGGDLYDLWIARDAEQGDRLHVIIGDISGKGLPASLMMTQLSAFLRVMADRRVNNWGRLAQRLNALMNEVRDRNRYATLVAASINPINGDLRYLNGGHNPPILIPGNGGPIRRLYATGPVIGLLPDAVYYEGHEVMAPGDVLVLFTDGLVEVQDTDGLELGDDKVVSAAQALPETSADEIFEQILIKTFSHAKENGFRDDMTLLVIKRRENI